MEDIMKKFDRIIVTSIILVLSLVLVGTAAAANPSVRVTKEPATQTVKPGDPASFTFTLTNTGDVRLTPIAILDYINGVKIPECSRNLTGLNAGESVSYSCSHGGETASYTNIVSAIAWSPTTATYTMWNDSAEVEVANAIPVADAGLDQVVECTGNGQATVTLDASGSSDPDRDVLQYSWSAPGITFTNPTGAMTEAVFPLGTTLVTLTVKDGFPDSEDTDTVQITVQDTTPPVLTPPAATTIFTCVSPNIGTATAVDTCGVTAVTITNNAPTTFPLGETTVTWTATDAAGNAISASQKVTAILGDDPSCCPAGTNIILGTAGDDDLVGTFGNDCILGLAGADTLNGKKGNDFLSGGDGLDTLVTDNGIDYLVGGPGRDKLNAGKGKDICVIDRTDNVVNCEKRIYYQ